MARVQYGVVITSLKGNIGGSTFQNGNVSNVLRNKGYRSGTSSLLRKAANNALTGQASAWRSLSDIERAAWESATDTWPFTDKFGNTYVANGYQLFVAWNSGLIQSGFPPVIVPSAVETLENVEFEQPTFSIGGGFSVSWVNNTAITQIVQVFASTSISAGQNNSNKRMKLIALADANDVLNADITAEYQNLWGQALIGAKIVVRFQVRGQIFPRIFQTYTTSLIVTA